MSHGSADVLVHPLSQPAPGTGTRLTWPYAPEAVARSPPQGLVPGRSRRCSYCVLRALRTGELRTPRPLAEAVAASGGEIDPITGFADGPVHRVRPAQRPA